MNENKRTISDLQQMQCLPLQVKIKMTERRIRDWVDEFGEDGVYVSFSGGKDSTVLLDICRKLFPDIKAMFVDVPTQYPELRQFVKTYDNVDIVIPKKNFMQVCKEYGFPLISKEVSECVSGARKYLTKILQESSLDKQASKQASKQATDITTINLLDRVSMLNPSGGGYDNKYRKLRGIGEYTKQEIDKSRRWQQQKVSNNVGMANERQKTTNKGEYP